MTKRRTSRWDQLLELLLAIVVVSILSMFGLQALGGPDNVRAIVASAGRFGPVIFILLKIATNVIAPLSGAPLIITGSLLFGTWEGLIYLLLGDLLGANINFWIARILGRPGIRRVMGARALQQVDEAVRHAGGWRMLLAASFVLSVIYDFVSYAAGLSNIKYKYFFWITFVSCLPTTFVYLFVGRTLVSGTATIYGFVILGVILGLVWSVRWVRGRISG